MNRHELYRAELSRNAKMEAKAAAARSNGQESVALTQALLTQYVCANDKVGECIRSALNAWSFRYEKDMKGKLMRTCNLCQKTEEASLTAVHICSRDAPIIEHPPVVPSKVGGKKCGLCHKGPGKSHACPSRLFKRCMVDAHAHPDLNPELVLKSQASSQEEVSTLLDKPTKLDNRSLFMRMKSDGYVGAVNVVQGPTRLKGSIYLSATNVFVGDAGLLGRGVYALNRHDQRSPLSLMYGGDIHKPTTVPASEPGLSDFDREIVLRDGSICEVNVQPRDTKCIAYFVNHAHYEPNMESVEGSSGIVLVPVRTIMPGEQLFYNYFAVCDAIGEEMMCQCDRCSTGMTPEGRDRYMVVWKGRTF